jgi:hypothetical protein
MRIMGMRPGFYFALAGFFIFVSMAFQFAANERDRVTDGLLVVAGVFALLAVWRRTRISERDGPSP